MDLQFLFQSRPARLGFGLPAAEGRHEKVDNDKQREPDPAQAAVLAEMAGADGVAIQLRRDRKYIREDPIEVTRLGFEVTDVLKEYCPSVVSVEFTRQLEEKMEAVQQGKLTKEHILEEAVEILKPVVANLKANEKAVGEQLSRAVLEAKLEDRVIGACPTCKNGKLVILYSKKTRKRFAGCTNYFNGTCKTAYPLPQRGFLKPTGKTCKNCGGPTLLVWLRGKRPWNLCLNLQCPQKTKKKVV